MISTRLITSETEVAELTPRWEMLALRDRAAPAAVPSGYLATLAADEKTQPVVVAADDAEELGGLVIARTSTRSIGARLGDRRIGGPVVRALDVLNGGLLIGNDADVIDALARGVRTAAEETAADVIAFNHAPYSGPLISRLADRFGSWRFDDPVPHWWFDFAPGPWSATADRFGKKHRYNLRRSARLMGESLGSETELDVLEAPAFDRIDDIRSRSWQSRHGRTSPAESALLRAAADNGNQRTIILRSGDTDIAVSTAIRCGTIWHLRMTAYDQACARFSPGQFLLFETLRTLRELGAERLDYGLGDADYKRRYGTGTRLENTVHCFMPTARGLAARAFFDVARTANGAIKRCTSLTSAVRRWRRAA